MQATYLLLLSTLLNNIQYKTPEEDLVENLPDYEYKGKLYSGYLTVSPLKHFHYMFNLAEEDPEKKPLVLWLNGGPGCSSLDGWSMENGPMFLNRNGTYRMNEYSWNKAANMLYLESPGDVGFSYINSGLKDDQFVSDDTVAKDNLNALLSFLTKFPEYKGRDFFITGESYGGIYIPMLALEIVNYNKNVPEKYKINLKGILVGNGLANYDFDGTFAMIDYMFSHHLISYEMKMNFRQECLLGSNSTNCNNIYEKIMNVTKDVNIYNYLGECETPTTGSGDINYKSNYYLKNAWAFEDLIKRSMKKSTIKKFVLTEEEEEENHSPCIDDTPMINYFNREDVRNALHVNKTIKWEMCNNKLFDTYYRQEKASFWAYPTLFKNNIRVLIFNGDADIVVPFNGNERFVESLNLEEVSPWRSWRAYGDKNNIAGYVVKYKELTFCTIKGAGHEVPRWKPKESYYMFTKFLNNEDF